MEASTDHPAGHSRLIPVAGLAVDDDARAGGEQYVHGIIRQSHQSPKEAYSVAVSPPRNPLRSGKFLLGNRLAPKLGRLSRKRAIGVRVYRQSRSIEWAGASPQI
jgi:hypothetical protein